MRTDIVELYIARMSTSGHEQFEFLQLRRVETPMAHTWQPIMGHVERGETAIQAVLREAYEETGIDLQSSSVHAYQLEQSTPYFLGQRNEIVLPARFLALLLEPMQVTLNQEHDALRWITDSAADHRERDAAWFWPSQRIAIAEASELLRSRDSRLAQELRVFHVRG